MQNHEIREHISNTISVALDYNSTNSCKRFFPMMASRHGKLNEYGVYDYQTKKYALFNTRARTVDNDLVEFNKFVTNMVKIAPSHKRLK